MLLLQQVCVLWFSTLRRLPLQMKCEYIISIKDGDRLPRDLPFGFVLLTALPFALDLTSGRSSSISASAFEMVFFVETLRDFLSDTSTVLLLAFPVGASMTESSTAEVPSLGFFVRFGGAFVSSGMICQSGWCSRNKEIVLCGRDFELLDEAALLFGLLTSNSGSSMDSLESIYVEFPMIIPIIPGGCSSVTTSIVLWDCLRGLLRRAGLETSLSVDLARVGDADALRRGFFNGEAFPRRMSSKVLRFVGTNILYEI